MVATIIEHRNKVSPAPIPNPRPIMQSENKLLHHRMELEFQRRKWVKVVIRKVMASENNLRCIGKELKVQMHK